jgi:uncharacterized membrane protein
MEATRNVATTALDAAKDTLANSKREGQEGLFRQVFLAAREAAGEVLEREARSAARQAAEVLAARAPEIAREQLAKRGGTNAAGRAAVEYGRAKLQGAGGTKALTAAAVGAAKESAGGLKTKVTDALTGEKGEDAEGGTSRLPVEVSLDIGAPRQVVWDEWTEFENSPESLHRIQSTEDGAFKVSSKVWGSTKEEEVEITEQIAEERLAWRAYGAIPYRGVVTFHSLDENLTRLLVTLEFEPQGLLARLGAGARSIDRGVEADVKRFKADLETRVDDDGSARLEEGDEDEQVVDEEPEMDLEAVGDLDEDAELDEDLPDAEYDDVDEPEDEADSEPEEEEEPTPRRRASRASAGTRGHTPAQSKRGSSSGGGRGRSASSSSKSTGSRKSSSARSSGRKSDSASSRSQSRSSGSRPRAASRKS